MSPNLAPRIFLKKGEESEIVAGFPWVFDNEIGSVTDGAGVIVDVFSTSGLFLGCGVYNKTSKIAVRIFEKERAASLAPRIAEYFLHNAKNALHLRKTAGFTKADSFRACFAEADFFPGLIIEKFGAVLVVQFLALACDMFRQEILAAFLQAFKDIFALEIEHIFERSDAGVRTLEGLEQKSGWILGGAKTPVTIEENGVRLKIDIENGQKTGYFLDQKQNRQIAAKLASFLPGGAHILDAFSHTGAFGLNCALAAKRACLNAEILALDISDDAVNLINENIALNGVQNMMSAKTADVFDALKDFDSRSCQFDMIILDPPAFAKNAKSIDKAFGGYKEINLRAMKILKENGILISCSCSHFMNENLFYSMLGKAALDVRRRIQIIEKRGASPDHPLLLGYAKSEYLKCAVMRVI